MNKTIILITGVPLVRVAYMNKLWYVQQRKTEDSQDWENVSDGFKTSSKALDAAPYLCNF